MTKLLAAVIVGLFAVAGNAFAEDKKDDTKKPTAEECKKAMEAKKEMAGCMKKEEKKEEKK